MTARALDPTARRRSRGPESTQDVDRVDPSPHDRKSKHVRNPILSEAADVRHVTWRGDIMPQSDARNKACDQTSD